MDLNFAEFLEEYVPIMPESIKDGILNRLTYSENLTKISFYITFPHLVPAQDLVALEHELEIRLKFMLFVCIHGMPQNCFLWHIFRIWSCF
ncbi:MAG: PolC-type DNA polymerase III N-terminal domain-containing protein [Ruminococcus callidus]